MERWLSPFIAALGHKTRARMCHAYVAGLIGPGDRKSIQPMGARDSGVSYDQLHHFIGSGIWEGAPLEAALLSEADKLVGGDDAWLIIDDTACLLARRALPVTLGLRLFLPESWTNDPERMAQACIPEDRRSALTKPEIAIEEIDRVVASGVRFGCMLADAGYGSSGPFRQALSERGRSGCRDARTSTQPTLP